MTKADAIIAAGRRFLGCTEAPRGSNDGTCVRHIQSSTGAYRAPWCGSFVARAYMDAGVEDDGIISASTWQTVANARARGALLTTAIPGCIIVWRPGASGHMEIVERVLSATTVQTIGGNVSDSVKQSYRTTAGAYLIAPAALREPPPPVYRMVWWWEDDKAEPDRHGLYAATASREKAIRAWVDDGNSPGHVRRGKLSVKDARGRLVPRYTFWTGPRKRSPDFLVKAKRDADVKKVSAERPTHTLRKRSRRERVS